MQKYLFAIGLAFCGSLQASDEKPWTIYSKVDLFAYSEPVSIDQFASDFDDDLQSGDTAFTHDVIEIGGKWKNFRLAYVHRFDYVTNFTDDTAFYHHSVKNGIPVPNNRQYDLLLDVERLEAKGLKIGYNWNFYKGMSVDVSYAYYSDLSSLQSGFASTFGDLEPFTPQLKADAQAIIDSINAGNRDLSGLTALAQNVNADVAINYLYDEPKFGEPTYRKPNITGTPNPVISGVNFGEPDGSGYSIDIGFAWQVNDQLDLNLQLIDVSNRFSWNNAPRTTANFDLNAFLLDAINVAQDFVNGAVITPNELIDRHVFVTIANEDYEQKLDMRYNFEANYDLQKEIPIFGWTPNLSVLGGYYHTESKDFPRVGISLDRMFTLEYDIGAEAVSLAYEGKYGFIRVISDDFGYKNARTFGISAGINYSF